MWSVWGISTNQRNGVMEQIGSLRPDLVVAELRLIGGERIELIHRIKKRFPDVPLLVLTVYGDSIHGGSILEAGANAHVYEPEKRGKVLQTIRRLLQPSRMMEDKPKGG